MNSVLSTSPFANFDADDPTRNGTLHAEARLLRQLSKVNGCLARNQNFSRNEALLQNLQNLPPEEEHEITLTVTSRSVSRLQGKNVSSGTTVAKLHSKTTLKKKEPRNSTHGSGYIDSQKHATSSRDSPNRRDKDSKENYDHDVNTMAPNSLDFTVRERNACPSKTQESQLSPNSTRNTEDRTIGAALFSCPVELIEIYPGNKEQPLGFNRRFSDASRDGSSMRSFPKEDDETSKSSVLEEDIYLFTKVRSKKAEEVCEIGDSSVECPRKNEKDREESFYKSASGVLQNGDSGQPTRDRQKLDRSSKQFEIDNLNSVTILKESERSGLKRKQEDRSNGEKMANDAVSKKMLEEEDPTTLEGENQSVVSSSSRESNVFNSDTHYGNSVSSSESGISKLMLDSDQSSIYGRSETDVSSMENTVVDLRERKSNSERRNVNTDEKNKKMIIDKRETEKNGIVDTNNSQMSKINESEIAKDRGFEKGTTRFAIKNLEDRTIDRERNQLNVNNGDVKICKLLMEIHEHLSSDWQRMECIRAKQHGGVSVDSLCLKVVFNRCRNYICGSSDSYKAEIKITKLFSKHVIQLVNAVNQNKLIIEEHERQLNSMQSEFVREQGGNKKRGTLNEDVSFWDRWTCEISCAIGSIFKLIKCVMTINEEKENVQNLQQCKLTNCRGTNASSANDKKQKYGVVRSKMADLNPTRKKSSIETQMSVAFNSNNPLKQSKSKASVKLVSPRNHEKEKIVEAIQNRIVEKKVSDNGRHNERKRVAKKPTLSANFNQSKQLAPRQKHRASSNPQPVWRPGGTVKLPSSSSATTLTQKYRPFAHAKEKVNQPVENTKETKQGRTVSEFKKKVSQETYSMKDVFPTLETDVCKISKKRSNASLMGSPRPKPRPGTLGVASQGYNEPQRACSKNCEKTSSWEKIARQKTLKESRVLRVLEEIIKSTPIEKRGNKKTKNVVNCYRTQVETNSPRLEQTTIKEERKIQEEEPTRDVDSSQLKKSRPEDSENHRSVEKLPEQTLTYDVTPLFTNVKEVTTDAEVSVKIENSQQNTDSSFVSVVSASCMADFSSSSDCVARIESSKCCQTSLNSGSSSCTSNPEQKDERSRKRSNLRVSFVNCIEDRQRCNEENSTNSIVVREEKNLSVVGEEMSENLTLFKEESKNPLLGSIVAEKISNNVSIVRGEKSNDPSIVKVENSKNPIWEEVSKNPSVSEEMLKNLSTSKEEKSDVLVTRKEKFNNPSIVKFENLKNPIWEEVSKNPPVNGEMLKNLSTSKEEKSDVLVTRKENSNNPSIVKVENSKNAICEGVCYNPPVNEEMLKNLSSSKEEKSDVLVTRKEKSNNPSIVKVENLKNPIWEEVCNNSPVNGEMLKNLSTSKEVKSDVLVTRKEKSNNPSIVKVENLKNPIWEEVCNNSPVDGEMLKNLSTSKEEKSDVLITRKEKSNNPSIVKVENLKNPIWEEVCNNSPVNGEMLKNLSTSEEEKSNNPSIVKVENLKNPIWEKVSKNPSSNGEMLKNLSTFNGEKFDVLVTRKEKFNDSSIVKVENSQNPICEEVCNNPPVNEEMLKNLSTSKEVKSDVLVTRKEKSNDSSIVRKERLKNATIRDEKSKNPLAMKVEKPITNPHTTSLTMLKEFLYNQGVDIDLVNKAEQCLIDKQRIRRRLKQISTSSVDVSSSIRGNKDSNTPRYKEGKLGRAVESNEDDSVNRGGRLKRHNIATCTEKNSKDAFSHTGFQWCTTKSLQTIPEENAFASTKRQNIGTQTEIASVKHVASECREKMPKKAENLTKNTRNVSTMTNSFPISDNFTETIRVSYVSKSVATERVDFPASPEKCPRQNCNHSSEKTIRKDDRGSLKKCRHELGRLLNQTQRDEQCSMNCGQNASLSSSSLDLSFEYLENRHQHEMAEKESNKLAEVISSETMAALRIAEIQARNVYRAIDMYKRHLKDKSKEFENQTEQTTNKDFESCKEILECLYKSNDFDIVVTRSYDRLDSDDDREASEVLGTPEVASASSKESIDRRSKSERVISKFVSTSSVNVPLDESIFGEIDSEIPRKSSSSVVLKDARSLVEFLVHETEDATVEQIRCVQKISNSKNLRFREKISKTSSGKLRNRCLLFSRENVLPLVYGVVCSIVFWCLQFTITCDIVA
ncbi:uncharacterized protein LOC143342820 [Colletes latitarsis]|uniref:uncharacterized protein LOC143342820 n=1 Tax=Colletes latitarsis TaxID=2605962 RepID=UPI004036B589